MAGEARTTTSVTPYLSIKGAGEAIAFYEKAFGAVEMHRMACPQTGMILHAALKVGDGLVFLSEEFPQCGNLGPRALGGTPVTIHLHLPDVDATFARAVEAGATSLMAPENQFWGDRFAKIEDPFGHRWSLATTVETLTPEQMRERMVEAMAAMAPASA
jgi:uncharacterized glyoxalase superfamily protein PhnB